MINHTLLFINVLLLIFVFIFVTEEEEEAEVKKTKFYQPATKFVSPHATAVSFCENKKSVSLTSLSVASHVTWWGNVGVAFKNVLLSCKISIKIIQ